MWNLKGEKFTDFFTYYVGSITTAVVLGILYGIANTFRPLPEDIYRYGISFSALVLL